MKKTIMQHVKEKGTVLSIFALLGNTGYEKIFKEDTRINNIEKEVQILSNELYLHQAKDSIRQVFFAKFYVKK